MSRRTRVLKADAIDAAGVGAGTVAAVTQSFHMADLVTEAREVLTRAREEATRIIAEARAEGEVIRASAHDEGSRVGHAEGLEAGRRAGHEEALTAARETFDRQHGSLVASCREIIQSINDQRAAWEAEARRDLIDLAMAIARRVVYHVGERDRQVVAANLAEAIRLAGKRSEVRIAVHPIDAEAARTFADSLSASRDSYEHVEVCDDESLSPGGCRVQWDSGAVDAGLETQLDRIERELESGSTTTDEPEEATQA